MLTMRDQSPRNKLKYPMPRSRMCLFYLFVQISNHCECECLPCLPNSDESCECEMKLSKSFPSSQSWARTQAGGGPACFLVRARGRNPPPAALCCVLDGPINQRRRRALYCDPLHVRTEEGTKNMPLSHARNSNGSRE